MLYNEKHLTSYRQMAKMTMYKGYEIEVFGPGYTVFFEGDEVYFDTVEEAKAFIDEEG